jgi:hypothetical protein
VILFLAPLFWVGGCYSRGAEEPSPSKDTVTPGVHEHKAPHGGILVELGEEFAHVELVLDREQGRMTAYVLDGEAENAIRVALPELEITALREVNTLRLAAVANVMTGETVGNTSEFVVQSDTVKSIRNDDDGILTTITVRGVSFENVKFSFKQ